MSIHDQTDFRMKSESQYSPTTSTLVCLINSKDAKEGLTSLGCTMQILEYGETWTMGPYQAGMLSALGCGPAHMCDDVVKQVNAWPNLL